MYSKKYILYYRVGGRLPRHAACASDRLHVHGFMISHGAVEIKRNFETRRGKRTARLLITY